MTVLARVSPRLPFRRPALPGISAILVKDLRGRMRGRRAFIVLTIYLLLLAGFGWMVERISEETLIQQSCPGCFSGSASFGSATVGRGIFEGILMLQTLIVAVLAPAATAGAISSEREHQTLELLAVTPISSLAIVLGKLLSALAWVFVLVLASVPITGLVFLFGGVAPDDLVRGYVVVLATAIGLGSIGLFFSALLKRTGASTGLTFVAMIVLAVGSAFMWVYMLSTSRDVNGNPRTPPEAILWLNPFVAQADVACGTEGGTGSWCAAIATITGTDGSVFQNDVTGVGVGVGGGPVPVPVPPGVVVGPNGQVISKGGVTVNISDAGTPPDGSGVDPTTLLRDRFWPKTVVSFLVLAIVLTLASVQLVTPTRRWRRPRLGRPGRGRPSVTASTREATIEEIEPGSPGAADADRATVDAAPDMAPRDAAP